MRLHVLTFSAFGPFGGTETVDFDRLADAGLFLLHGPTGAGKTTVLDAVSFALFAKVPGVRASGESLRSDFADRDTATEVRLELSVGDRRFRVVRRPRQVRAKTRGEGVRDYPAEATIAELVDGTWVPRAAGPSDADPFLAEQLAMGPDQFHQLVMLPQGEFARFLRATGEDRRQVLEQLFGTHRFAEVERWLKLQAEGARDRVRQADEQLRRLLVEAATVAVVEAEPFADERPVDEAPGWLAELLDRSIDHLDETVAIEHAHRAAHTDARALLVEATATADHQRRHATAAATAAALAELSATHCERQARHQAARRAALVLPLVRSAERAALARHVASDALAARRGDLALILDGTPDRPHVDTADRVQLAGRHDELVAQAAMVADLYDDERERTTRADELAELDQRVASVEAVLEAQAAERQALPARRAELEAALVDAERADVTAADLADQVSRSFDRHQAAVERDQQADDLARAAADLTRCTRAELDARAHRLSLFERQLRTRAAVLAATLVDGEACPICGSHEHPAPAAGHDDAISDAELVAAQAAEDAAAGKAASARDQHSRITAELASLTDRAAGASAVDLAALLDEQRGALTDARRRAGRRAELADERDAIDDAATAIDAQLDAGAALLAQARHEQGALGAALAADNSRIDEARAGWGSLAERHARLDIERRAVAALIDALDELARSDMATHAADIQAGVEAEAQGFATVADAAAAAMGATELDELEACIAAHERAVIEADTELARPELVTAAARPPVDLEPLRDHAVLAERDRDLAGFAAEAAAAAVAGLRQRADQVDRALAQLNPAMSAYERARRLADLANGDDRQVEHRMRLSSYVLSARLEQVAAAASQRLQRMSDGQFTLVHTDDAVDGRRKGGLGLRVVDAWTGTERETSTLSGGQSFFTSLALALGVADVVSAELGGARIDTLFIDEGFGSLDDDTLEQVMDVLDDLRAGGRAVGLVSHVADLRNRITSQLEVVRRSTGSHLRGTAAASPDSSAGSAAPAATTATTAA